MVVLNSLVSGIWWGATALVWQTVWPAVLFHSLSNAAVQIKGLADATIQPSVTAYARATLLELPLVLVGLWLLWRWVRRAEAMGPSRLAPEPVEVRADPRRVR
jgi:hypothetical protein